jgi:hypothetical protein
MISTLGEIRNELVLKGIRTGSADYRSQITDCMLCVVEQRRSRSRSFSSSDVVMWSLFRQQQQQQEIQIQ